MHGCMFGFTVYFSYESFTLQFFNKLFYYSITVNLRRSGNFLFSIRIPTAQQSIGSIRFVPTQQRTVHDTVRLLDYILHRCFSYSKATLMRNRENTFQQHENRSANDNFVALIERIGEDATQLVQRNLVGEFVTRPI